MPPRSSAAIKVGVLVLVALVALSAAIFLVGERQFLFSRKNRYFVEFENVANLTVGNPVQLNGVNVGKVEEINLPDDLGPTVRVWVTVNRRYADRIRQDTLARIQTLGLLGDKYIALNSGSPDAPVVEAGGEIPAAPATEIDELLASGGDVVDNLSVAASSLSDILARMERGEGVLGALLSEREGEPPVDETIATILADLRDVLHDIKEGEGTLGRLLHDDTLAIELEGAIAELQRLTTSVTEGDGLLPALLGDPELRESFASTLESFESTTAELDSVVTELGSGEGLLPQLMTDEELAREMTADLRGLLDQLNQVAEKLNQGEGTAARLLNDPGIYEAISDILVGVNESRMLRWLLRNRQRAGIRERFEEAQGGEEGQGAVSGEDQPQG